MSCVPCLECGGGSSITKENLDRWTDSCTNVLASSEGRQHFKRYLESRSLEESLYAVEFWERCVRIMPQSPGGDSPPHSSSEPQLSCLRSEQGESSSASSHHRLDLPKSSSPPRVIPVSDYLHRELKLLVEFADNYDVNLDRTQMSLLHKAQKMTEEAKVTEVLMQSKQSAMELLLDDYELFRVHLLNSHGH